VHILSDIDATSRKRQRMGRRQNDVECKHDDVKRCARDAYNLNIQDNPIRVTKYLDTVSGLYSFKNVMSG